MIIYKTSNKNAQSEHNSIIYIEDSSTKEFIHKTPNKSTPVTHLINLARRH